MKQDDTGFFQVPNAFIQQYGAQVGLAGCAVYSALLMHDFGNDQCWPSQGHIADLFGCDRKTVNRTVAKLVEAGLVEVVTRKNDQGQTSNLYRLKLKVAPTKQRKSKPAIGPDKQTFETVKGDTYDLDW